MYNKRLERGVSGALLLFLEITTGGLNCPELFLIIFRAKLHFILRALFYCGRGMGNATQQSSCQFQVFSLLAWRLLAKKRLEKVKKELAHFVKRDRVAAL